jgi:hypothetical protein
LPLKLLAIAAVVVSGGITASWSSGAIDATQSKITCDRVASPLGANVNPGTLAKPFATVDKLMSVLRAGQTGCLRAGVYDGDVRISRGGAAGTPITITSYPGERATVQGRLHVAEQANNVIVQQLDLDGRNGANLPSPTINGDNVTFRDNDVTNHHTSICFLLGSIEYGRARNSVIERNRIHNCGQLPPTNHHHGIYIEVAQGARIVDNWIYDNADRGIQMFPDAQNTYIARNVIDGNGEGVVFSRRSGHNLVEQNVMSNPVVRYNLEDYELSGYGNVARLNCVWSARDPGFAGIQPDISVPVIENRVVDPAYVNRDAKDFRLQPGSPCSDLSARSPLPPPHRTRTRRSGKRPVDLHASAAIVWPGGRLRLRAKVVSASARSTAQRQAVLRLHRGGIWRRVAVMRLRNGRFAATLRLAQAGRRSPSCAS